MRAVHLIANICKECRIRCKQRSTQRLAFRARKICKDDRFSYSIYFLRDRRHKAPFIAVRAQSYCWHCNCLIEW
jgi:hypothetical protein